MARPNFGPEAKKRVKRLLDVLLSYANDDLEFSRESEIQINWQTDNQLVVRTKIRFLEELTILESQGSKLDKDQIKEALKRLQDFMEILVDNRSSTKGSEIWHFTLKLWHPRLSKNANLERFDIEWERRRSVRSKQITKGRENIPPHSGFTARKLHDWGQAIDVSVFYGRTQELTDLEQWIVKDHCRVIALVGMGGIGKTALSIKLAQQIQNHFEILIWRSLKSAPSLDNLLNNLLKCLDPASDAIKLETIEKKIEQLIEYLRTKQCIIILDNLDVLLEAQQNSGTFQNAYRDYESFFQSLGEISHKSSIIFTSREKLHGMEKLEGENLSVRNLFLAGIDFHSSHKLLDNKKLIGSRQDFDSLIKYYHGHPLALKIVSTSICELFCGNIAHFLHQGTGIFNGIQNILAKQLTHLSDLEESILYWLAINHESTTIVKLLDDLMPEPTTARLLEALESLNRRSLIEITFQEGNKHRQIIVDQSFTSLREENNLAYQNVSKDRHFEGKSICFSLQPFIMECLISFFIEKIFIEIKTINPCFFLSHLLIKAQNEDNLRDYQTRLIVEPITNQLKGYFGTPIALSIHLRNLLKYLYKLPAGQIAYGGGNILNIYRHLKTDLTNYNFSNLSIRQAILHDISLRQTNFSNSAFRQCSFANTFGGITNIAFSKDGNQFAVCDTNGNVSVWSAAGMHPIAKCIGHEFWAWAVAFHPTQPILASCGQDKTIRLCEISTGHCFKILHGHSNPIMDVSFSPDGESLISASSDTTIRQWDVRTGECIQILDGHDQAVQSSIFTPNGQHIYSCGEDNCIRYWDLQSGECLKIFTGHTQWIMELALSPDGLHLASASMDNTVKLWDTNTGHCINTLKGHTAPVLSVAFSPNGKLLASGSYDQTIRLWYSETGECSQVLSKHRSRVWRVKFHPNGKTLASGGDDYSTRFWNLQTGESIQTIQGHSNAIHGLALHPQGNLLVSAHEDQTIRLWNLKLDIHDSLSLKSVEPFKTIWGHQNRVRVVRFSPDGKTFASASSDRSIILWSSETYQSLLTLQGHKSWIWDIAFHSEGNIIASASYDGTVKLWNINTGSCINSLEGHDVSALSVAFSPNGEWLASGGYGQLLKVWQAKTGKCIRTWCTHTNHVWAVKFSPDSQCIATSGDDFQIHLWDVETGNLIQTLCSHQKTVLCIRFSADNRYLFSSSNDHTIKKWDLMTGQCLQTFLGHKDKVWSLELAPNEILLSSSHDESILCWDLNTQTAFQRLEVPRPYTGMNITNTTGLTAAQRQTLITLGAFEKSIDQFH